MAEVALVEVDFETEGLAVAVCRRAEQEIGLTPRAIGKYHDRAANRYVFDWPSG